MAASEGKLYGNISLQNSLHSLDSALDRSCSQIFTNFPAQSWQLSPVMANTDVGTLGFTIPVLG